MYEVRKNGAVKAAPFFCSFMWGGKGNVYSGQLLLAGRERERAKRMILFSGFSGI
jgi:hypothetical protein